MQTQRAQVPAAIPCYNEEQFIGDVVRKVSTLGKGVFDEVYQLAADMGEMVSVSRWGQDGSSPPRGALKRTADTQNLLETGCSNAFRGAERSR